jgi:hypothetical protein
MAPYIRAVQKKSSLSLAFSRLRPEIALGSHASISVNSAGLIGSPGVTVDRSMDRTDSTLPSYDAACALRTRGNFRVTMQMMR